MQEEIISVRKLGLDFDEIARMYVFVRRDLSKKYDMAIDIEEGEIVTGLLGYDDVEEAIKIIFFPSEAKVPYIEDKINSDMNKYIQENEFHLQCNVVIERDMWLGKIRYKLVYTRTL